MLRILLIDDSVDDRILARHFLEKSFPEAKVQEIGQADALQQALDLGAFDLVITDYQLRWSTGLEVLHIIKSQYPDCPVVMFTNSGCEEIAVEGMKAGLSDYVLKGKRLNRLAVAVHESLAKAKLQQQYKEAMQQLSLSETRYRMVSELASDFAYAVRIEPGGIFQREWITDAFTRITGYTLAELDHLDGWRHLVHPEDWAMVLQHREELHAGQDSICEFRIVTKSGEIRWLRNSGHPTWDESAQRATLIYGAAQDITEQKQAELALQQQAEELREANRLKDEFLATLSHELRTPLNAIVGWTQVLRSRKVDPVMLERALETIERNAKLQTQLVEDILDVSRIIRGKLELKLYPINLSPVLYEAIESLKPAAAAKSLRLTIRCNEMIGLVLADPNRIHQIIWNLLSNAIKFTPEQGHIEIDLKRVSGQAHIIVRDTGIGIHSDFLPHIFDRFSQADSSTTRAYRGLGLGLAIVRHLVEMHNGSVQADSPGEGQGATFTIRLPLIHSLQDTSSNQPELPLRTNLEVQLRQVLRGLKVVVVDDEPDVRDIICVSLQHLGADVVASSSAAEAFLAVQQHLPHVLVSDVGMPGEDGYKLLQQLRSLAPEQGGDVPAIALTAYARTEDRIRALSSGFQVHVPKPVELAELVTVIANLTGRLDQLNHPVEH
jgi:PAS domain S-box-containing protein